MTIIIIFSHSHLKEILKLRQVPKKHVVLQFQKQIHLAKVMFYYHLVQHLEEEDIGIGMV